MDSSFFFFFNDTATTEIYTLSLHDALPISPCRALANGIGGSGLTSSRAFTDSDIRPSVRLLSRLTAASRSEEHTSELQSQSNLVCRLLLEKKKKKKKIHEQALSIKTRN